MKDVEQILTAVKGFTEIEMTEFMEGLVDHLFDQKMDHLLTDSDEFDEMRHELESAELKIEKYRRAVSNAIDELNDL